MCLVAERCRGRRVSLLFLLPALLLTSAAGAEETSLSAQSSLQIGPDGRGQLSVQIEVPEGWHLWSLHPGPGPLPLTIEAEGPISFEGPWSGDAPQPIWDRGFQRELKAWPSGSVRLGRRARLSGAGALSLSLKGQICTDKQCINPRLTVPVRIERQDAPVVAGLPGAALRPAQGLEAAKRGGLWAFLLAAVGAGLLALATPCVFPAIPLTVSFFSKYSEASFGRGVRLAAVYAATMIAAYTGGGVLISLLFGATGLSRFSAHPVFNLGLGLMLVFFALNLLGMFELNPPAWLTAATNRLQARFSPRGPAAAEGGLGELLVVVVAALTATTVFFTCTVAFVGSVVVAAAQGEWFWPTLGMLAFSTAFAAPFFLLALFPQAARRLQGKGGSWMSATRVTLGFIELAAAFKFFSNADLVWGWALLSRPLVLSVWVALFGLCGLFLLGKLRLGEGDPPASLGVGRTLAAGAALALTVYLLAGLVQGRAFGGWLDGLLPPVAAAAVGPGSTGGLSWHDSRAAAQAQARAEGKRVFVNYTGFTCTNCRYMEGGVFTDPAVAGLLQQLARAELYTDGQEPIHEENRRDQLERFGTAALPFYAVERPDGTLIASFPSSTNDPAEFARFLRQAIEAEAPKAAEVPKAAEAPKAAEVPEPAEAPPKLAQRADCPALSGGREGARGIEARRLQGGCPAYLLGEPRYTLVNLWATWCAPCREELSGFLVREGAAFTARGGRFVTLALEEEESLPEAAAYMRSLGQPEDAALWRSPDGVEPLAQIGFADEGLPYTALLSPSGEVLWRAQGAITEAQLKEALGIARF